MAFCLAQQTTNALALTQRLVRWRLDHLHLRQKLDDLGLDVLVGVCQGGEALHDFALIVDQEFL